MQADLQQIQHLVSSGQARDALPLATRFTREHPNDAQGWFMLAGVHSVLGRMDDVIACCRKVTALDPNRFDALYNLGVALQQSGKQEEAATVFDDVVSRSPPTPAAHYNLALCLRSLGRPNEALPHLERAIALKPDFASAHTALGNVLMRFGRFADALRCFDRALHANPHLNNAWISLGNLYIGCGEVLEARDCYLKTAQYAPLWSAAHSNYLFSLNYLTMAPDEVLQAHCDWAARHAPDVKAVTHLNSPDPARRLRVGYVSPDFRAHAVAFFMKSVLDGHDRSAFEVVGFSNVQRPDEETRALQNLTDRWHDISRCGAIEAANLARSEGIDILVDLAGHTSDNRLDVFAQRSAPVQVSYLGYPNTTGLQSIDYRITDVVTDPPGESDAWNVEKLIRLPRTFLCYAPTALPLAIEPSPFERNGYVTLGSFNNLAKISPETLAAWATIFRDLTDARLVLKRNAFRDESVRNRVLCRFADHGLDPQRIELLPYSPSLDEHLSQYTRLDIALDTFPYNGTTTTCEALWMGVPVVSWYGQPHATRVGLSLLTALSLGELVCASRDEYVARVVELARAPERIRVFRHTLRDRLLSSPVCDKRGFVLELEKAYRDMWRTWCENRSVHPGAEARRR